MDEKEAEARPVMGTIFLVMCHSHLPAHLPETGIELSEIVLKKNGYIVLGTQTIPPYWCLSALENRFQGNKL